MMVEEIGVDLKISKSQCRELNSGPFPYQRRYKDILKYFKGKDQQATIWQSFHFSFYYSLVKVTIRDA